MKKLSHTKTTRWLLVTLSVVVGVCLLPIPQLYAATAAPADPPAGSSFDQRLAQRKAERAIKLDDKDQKRLTQQCTGAQGTIRTWYQAVSASINDRNQTYHRVDAKLWVIIGRLKLANKDTFKLEKQRSKFAANINDFQATAANFTQTLDDVQVVNCEADIIGFKALLETARLYYQQVVDKSDAIDAYVVNDIKSTLADHTADLQPKAEQN